jgi:hypothetical protein
LEVRGEEPVEQLAVVKGFAVGGGHGGDGLHGSVVDLSQSEVSRGTLDPLDQLMVMLQVSMIGQ